MMYAEWTQADVQRLAGRVFQLRGKWMLTLNDTPANRAAFEGCAIAAVERPRGINNKEGQRQTYREIIITPEGAQNPTGGSGGLGSR